MGIASRRWTARVSMMGWDDELTIEQFVGCVSGLCLSWCGAVSAVSGFSQGWRLERVVLYLKPLYRRGSLVVFRTGLARWYA